MAGLAANRVGFAIPPGSPGALLPSPRALQNLRKRKENPIEDLRKVFRLEPPPPFVFYDLREVLIEPLFRLDV